MFREARYNLEPLRVFCLRTPWVFDTYRKNVGSRLVGVPGCRHSFFLPTGREDRRIPIARCRYRRLFERVAIMRSSLSYIGITLRFLLGLFLLWYLTYTELIDWSFLGRLAAAWPLALLAVLLLLVDTLLTSWRFTVLLSPHGFSLSLYMSIRLTLMGAFFTTVIPGSTGGDLVRMYYASSGNAGRRMEIATILLLDRAVGLVSLLLWPILCYPFFMETLNEVWMLESLLAVAAFLVTSMLLATGFCLHFPVFSRRVATRVTRRIPFGFYAMRMYETVDVYRDHVRTLVTALVISIFAHGFMIGAFLVLVEINNTGGADAIITLLIPVAFVANVLPLTPGGLGVGEFAFGQVFSWSGFSGGAEVMLSWRVLTSLIDLSGLLFYIQGRHRYVEFEKATAAEGEP